VLGPTAGEVFIKLVIGFWVATREATTFCFLHQVTKKMNIKLKPNNCKRLWSGNLRGYGKCGARPFSSVGKQLDALALRLLGVITLGAGGSSGPGLLGGCFSVGPGFGSVGLAARALRGARSSLFLGSFFFLLFLAVLRILLHLLDVRGSEYNP
jgi:hypothetical protein